MGSPRWVHNPHLRARTAEALECLLPMHRVQQPGGNMIGMGGSFHREQLFTQGSSQSNSFSEFQNDSEKHIYKSRKKEILQKIFMRRKS